MRLVSAQDGAALPPPGRPAPAFGEGEYGRAVYNRTALVLETVARSFGRARFERALGEYARNARFRHPSPDDLFAAFAAVHGQARVDAILKPALLEGAVADAALVSLEATDRRALVHARRQGTLPLDLEIEVTDADGRRVRAVFPGDAKDHVIEVATEARAQRAVLDPERKNLLDRRRSDNVVHADPPIDAFLARLLHTAQTLLVWLGP
jgi:hypothetical protein